MHRSLKSELSDLRSKLDERNQSLSSMESRLFKSLEDFDHLRRNYHSTEERRSEMAATLQSERIFSKTQMNIFKKQRCALIMAYKKQLFLLDNLKRQNTCLEHAKHIQIIEKDFTRILGTNK